MNDLTLQEEIEVSLDDLHQNEEEISQIALAIKAKWNSQEKKGLWPLWSEYQTFIAKEVDGIDSLSHEMKLKVESLLK